MQHLHETLPLRVQHRPLEISINANQVVNLPDGYRNLLELEIKKDMSLAYHDEIGYRASTCTPFLFYDLDFEIKTPLIIHPIAATTSALRKQSDTQIRETVDNMMHTAEKLNGVFSILFSNHDFSLKI